MLGIEKMARVKLAYLPTPVEELPNLSNALGGARIFAKREDMTGLAIGGNKARKLEFIVADAIQKGADTLITAGAPQSNHARMTAAAAVKFGLKSVLVLTGEELGENQGNLLLDRLMGAEIKLFDKPITDFAQVESFLVRIAEEVKARGGRPYVIPIGGSNALGCLSYALAQEELNDQARQLGINFDHQVVAVGSMGTYSGLLYGAKYLGLKSRIVGISVSRKSKDFIEPVKKLCGQCADLAGHRPLALADSDFIIYDEYVGPGYGISTKGCLEAIRLCARLEGMILDPVYTGKVMAGLIDLIKKRALPDAKNVLFWHTGGAPGLFAMADEFN